MKLPILMLLISLTIVLLFFFGQRIITERPAETWKDKGRK